MKMKINIRHLIYLGVFCIWKTLLYKTTYSEFIECNVFSGSQTPNLCTPNTLPMSYRNIDFVNTKQVCNLGVGMSKYLYGKMSTFLNNAFLHAE